MHESDARLAGRQRIEGLNAQSGGRFQIPLPNTPGSVGVPAGGFEFFLNINPAFDAADTPGLQGG
ncbi:hypothetical protein AGMMS49545_03710 [Betaproteobacteria bacterium]|nr:hypothetical protein AGMMS49545_03710 [Betaproteobacteria bacterium]GHU41743.1 hypothetical protein AGMMS50289_05390 [Betaproteobacteria bacterium]